jgi:hypothetical protein
MQKSKCKRQNEIHFCILHSRILPLLALTPALSRVVSLAWWLLGFGERGQEMPARFGHAILHLLS